MVRKILKKKSLKHFKILPWHLATAGVNNFTQIFFNHTLHIKFSQNWLSRYKKEDKGLRRTNCGWRNEIYSSRLGDEQQTSDINLYLPRFS